MSINQSKESESSTINDITPSIQEYLKERGNKRYYVHTEVTQLASGILFAGIDIRRGGEVTLFYPNIGDHKAQSLLKEIGTTLTQNTILRETPYYTYRDANLDQKKRLFLVMDRPKGQPLYTLLRAQQSLDIDLALSLVIQLCELLKRAHNAQIFTTNISLHTLVVLAQPNGAMRLSLIDLALDRQPLSSVIPLPPRELTSPPHIMLTQEKDRRHYVIYLCTSLLHHLAFGVAPKAPVSNPKDRLWPSLPRKGRQLDERLESCFHTVLLKGLSVKPQNRFPRLSALQRTLIGLRQLTSMSSPAFELLSSTQRRLGQSQASLNLAAPRPGIDRALKARQSIHRILEGGDESITLEDVLKNEGIRLLR
jgi:hypothetical protein